MFSIDSESIQELGRVLRARAYAARTQLNTGTFEVAMSRLEDAIDQAEPITLDGRPEGVNISVWDQFEVELLRAQRDFTTLQAQARGQEPEDDWDTFGVTPGSSRVGDVRPTTFFTPSKPGTAGEPDVVGTKTVGSALPYQPNRTPAPPASSPSQQPTITTGSAINTFRQQGQQEQNGQSSFPVVPVVAGVAAFGVVAAILFMGRK